MKSEEIKLYKMTAAKFDPVSSPGSSFMNLSVNVKLLNRTFFLFTHNLTDLLLLIFKVTSTLKKVFSTLQEHMKTNVCDLMYILFYF